VEVKIIQVRLQLMMNKVFYLGLSLMMMMIRMMMKMVMMTIVVILMMNKISQELWMFEVIN
jgi:hypothetical protein